tara:strand:- start:31 stop:1461 length:1431 start_codon:yes stop_codon:yes gene_type:complete
MNQLEKLLWNNHKEIFTREKVIPKIKLKDHPDGDKKIIDINLLSPNPVNKTLYDDDDIMIAARDLAYGIDGKGTEKCCMKARLENGDIVNREPVQICCMTGKIWSGHTRYSSAKLIGAKYLYVVYADEIYSDDIKEGVMLNILHEYNLYKRAELSFKQQVNKTKALIKVIQMELGTAWMDINPLHETNTTFNKIYRNRLADLQKSFLNKEHKNLKYIKNIIKIIYSGYYKRIVKEIDEGTLALSSAIKELNQSKKKPYVVNTKRFNFLNHFDKTIAVKLKMKNYFSQARFNYFNTDIIKTENLGDINIVTDKVVGNEQPKKTGVLSDKMMSTLAIVYRELGFDTVTAGTATNSADIQFLDLTKLARQTNIDNPAEEIEVKAAVSKDDNATFYGGPDMKKHIKTYLLSMFNKDHSKAFMFLTDINGPLVVKPGSKDGTTMDFKTILKYHKKDIRPIYGTIDNNNQIIMEKIGKEVNS